MKKRNNIVMKSLFHNPLGIVGLTILYIGTSILTNLLSSGIGTAFDIGVSGSLSDFKTYMVQIILLIILLVIFQFLGGLFGQKYSSKVFEKIRVGIFNMISKQPLHKFIKNDFGEYSSFLINDVKLLEQQFLNPVKLVYQQIISLIIAILFIISINIPITIFVILSSLLPIMIPSLFGKRLASKFSNYSVNISTYSSNLKELIDGYDVIKTYNVELPIKLMHEKINKEALITKKSAYNELGLVSGLATVASFIVMMGVLIIGMFLSINGSLTIGEVFAIAFISSNISGPLSTISSNFSNIKSSKDIIRKFDIEENKEEELLELNTIDKGIEFINYSLTIDKPILKDINYTFEIGKKYAIIGGSGSGKSSLIRSMLGYYWDYDGKILVDNFELRTLDIENIYNNISYIPQKVSFFKGTIRENLGYFKPNEDSRFKKALELANINKKIENLPNKLDAEMDRHATEFSGGEKQRIGIARSMVSGKCIYILDEATSALDGKNYSIVENNILKKDITLITVTHRLERNILEKYDEIILMENGEIIAQGKFEEIKHKLTIEEKN